MSQSPHLDPSTTQQHLTEHRLYKYRGCAPDSDNPAVAAGDPSGRLPVGSWQAPDVDGAEDQTDRRVREAAAVEVCVDCPVMVQCLAYGSSITMVGEVAKLTEPYSILGGMTSLERHKAFIATRHKVAAPAPDRKLRTPQKLAVLRALAAHTDPYDVAAAAGMDVRTANWQRSILATKMNLPAGATRREMLAEAARRGLLDGVVVVEDDGSVPAVPPPTRMPPVPSAESVAVFATAVASVPASASGPSRPDGPGSVPYEPVRVPSPRRDRFTAVAGQLTLDDLVPSAPVTQLPVHAVLLEAAA